MRCKICNAYIPEGATHCLDCGTDIQPVIVCQRCGNLLSTQARFCNKCGAPRLFPPGNPSPQQSVIQTDEQTQEQFILCVRCRGKVAPDAKYCPWCGTSQDGRDEVIVNADNGESDPVERVANADPCPRCGTPPRGSGRFCHNCGRFMGGDIEDVVCVACGSTNSLRYARCQYCGADLPPEPGPIK